MSRSINRATILGNVGKDPEYRTLENGAKVGSFSVATTETYKDKTGDKKEFTDWHNVVVWRGLAEICEKYLKKGNKIHVEGKLRTRSWDDQDGKKNYRTEIIAENIILLGAPAGHETPQAEADSFQETEGDDDLPF